MTRLQISPLAEQDLEEIGDFIARDNPQRAMSFVEEIYGKCLSISETPEIYPLRPELGTGIRSCSFGRYIIFFTDNEKSIRIERVLHGARKWQSD
ncbi:type II toxin-antitoxin system RelE/ParE family toxin [Candidatus Pantoea multigeneris]|uniref:Type II toxin-antitoxin system RelE/ParE family toxin n=1 Tax=Candidatus Pantoea multigeneris TaxID=2608357 RepID=A0ABX0RBD8_9GAMM|nr:type II toxin-antitoxin system RelE/ParE family toxin [Pantoea multigeneris]NIF22392.1 type II toxin-antitoxin system RelE/ParE family toxin [Pantoea multigeneris]